MPLFDFLCADCGKSGEFLISRSNDTPTCRNCGSKNLKKLLSAHSSLSGQTRGRMPGPGDTACCGSTPARTGCAGPGSCCQK